MPNEKVDLTKTREAQLGEEHLSYLQSNGARALPKNPSASGWDAEAVRKQLYKQPEIIFAWLKRVAESQLDMGTKLNAYLDDFKISKNTVKVYESLASAQAALESAEIEEGSLVFVYDDDDITAYGTTNEGFVKIGDSFKEVHNTLISLANTIAANLTEAKGYTDSEVGKVKDGTYTAEKAKKDSSGNQITSTYETKTDSTSKIATAKAEAIDSAKNYTDGKFSNDAAFQKNVSIGEDAHVYGDAVIEGGLVVKGTNTTVESTTVSTKDVNIELAKGNTTKLTQIAGLHITNYDGSHTGGIGLNSDGFMLIGDMTKNQDGTISRGDAQEAATRADHGEWSDGELPVWDAEGNEYVPSGKNFASITAEINEGLATKQNTLVSGENIKTINGQSLVGGGDVMINSLMGIEFVDVGDYRYAVAIVSDDFDGEVACEDIGDYKYLTITYEEVI